MPLLLEVSSLALVGVIGALVLGGVKSEFSYAAKISALLLIMTAVVLNFKGAIADIGLLISENAEIYGYMGVVLRALGVALIGQFTSQICRDLGGESIASGVELAAKLEIFVLCLPLISEIMGHAAILLDM